MTATVNLTALAATRAKMTPGEYRIIIQPDAIMVTSSAGEIVCETYGHNAAGIVAEHNAIGVLMEIVDAAIAWRDESEEHQIDAAQGLRNALAKVSL